MRHAVFSVTATAMVGTAAVRGFVLPAARPGALVARAPVGLQQGAVAARTRSYGLCMQAIDDPMLKPLVDEDYVAVGLACCFVMNDNNKLDEYYVFEPLTAGTLETIEKGIETSYKRVMALQAKEYFLGSPSKPDGVNKAALQPLLEGEEAHMCENVVERSLAACRTFRRRVEAQLVGVGEIADDYNFSVARKRILNQVFEPSFDDNVKQDKSIDVYGRADDEEAAAAAEVERLANA